MTPPPVLVEEPAAALPAEEVGHGVKALRPGADGLGGEGVQAAYPQGVPAHAGEDVPVVGAA